MAEVYPQCKQASEMMSEWLDGRLESAEVAALEEHLSRCSECQAEWRSLQVLHQLLTAASMVHPPVRMRVHVMARLSRRDQARRAIMGGTALGLGTMALALLALAPLVAGLANATGIAPALIVGGPATFAQLLTVTGAMGRTLLVLAESLALPLACLSVGSLAVALGLNRLWMSAVRRARAAR